MTPSQAPHEIAAEAIRLFLKYRTWDGDEEAAKIRAVSDFIDAEPGECEPHPHWNMMTTRERDEAIKKAI
jgi:hypothetical protein